jgi:hypothetical protein
VQAAIATEVHRAQARPRSWEPLRGLKKVTVRIWLVFYLGQWVGWNWAPCGMEMPAAVGTQRRDLGTCSSAEEGW